MSRSTRFMPHLLTLLSLTLVGAPVAALHHPLAAQGAVGMTGPRGGPGPVNTTAPAAVRPTFRGSSIDQPPPRSLSGSFYLSTGAVILGVLILALLIL